jgi:phosphopantothenoylcysteine decarboxylase/phosphopantothenate--cysteine ligase
MFEDKKVLIGVSGGIAAYKTASLVSRLHKAGVEVHVIMTENATEFISPLVFETLSGQRCVVDTFDKNRQFEVEHVSLAKLADLFMIAPATADVIAKTANGLADDMLTTTFLASNCPKMVVPAMNTQMYLNPVTQDNLKKLKQYGIQVIEPAEGLLACGDTGKGKMPEPERKACSGNGGSNAGIDGSGPFHHQSFHWKNGFCPGEGMYVAGCGCNAGQSICNS